jgi:hypothetical protein
VAGSRYTKARGGYANAAVCERDGRAESCIYSGLGEKRERGTSNSDLGPSPCPSRLRLCIVTSGMI